MIKILVTGANGQLGLELQSLVVHFPTLNCTFVDRFELDITDQKAVAIFFSKHKFQYCINCAAYTAVDKAEQEKELCYAVNTIGAGNLASACNANNARLIHISSDYVYHNDCNRPLTEQDITTPQGVYAQTKLAGDELVMQLNPSAIVLRTSWVYSRYGNNFVKTMLRLGAERSELKVVYDQVGAPTHAADLALAITDLILSGKAAKHPGIYNYSNEGVTSWYDFAKTIFELANINCQVHPIESKEYPTPASRPHYSLLNKAKFKTTFGFTIPHWKESLIICLKSMNINAFQN